MIRSNHEHIVTIVFYPDYIACVCVRYVDNSVPFTLIAYERFDLAHLELESLIIYNPTALGSKIRTFLAKNNFFEPFALFALQGPMLFERYIEHTSSTAQRSDFAQTELRGRCWDYRYLYPTQHGNSVFYVAGFSYPLIVQYQLLALHTGLNLVAMVPAPLCILQVYKYQQGAAFRRAQLAIDMTQHHNITDFLCTADLFSRLVSVPSFVSIDRARDIRPILTACGMYISEGMQKGITDEKY